MRRTGNSLSEPAMASAACGGGGMTYRPESLLMLVPCRKSGRGGHGYWLPHFLMLQLQPVEGGVAPVAAQEIVVASGFHHRALLDHENAVGMRDRVQAVRD